MRYRFKEFEFDTTSLVLAKNGDVLPIRHNEAKLLVLLLECADQVLSKEDILSSVWQDKVVSDQAVFQNISHLRNLFGNDAIKTFSKRGYQWRLAFEPIIADDQSVKHQPRAPQDTQEQPAIKTSNSRLFAMTAVAALAAVVLVAMLINQSSLEQEVSDSQIKVAFIPIHQRDEHRTVSLEDNANFDFTRIDHLDYAKFMATAELEYPKLAAEQPLVLAGEIRVHKQKVFLDFLLKGPFGDWQGQLSADSNEEVLRKLQSHLNQKVIYDLLSNAQAPELKQAKLTIAHQNAPNDLIVLGELVQSYSMGGEYDKSMVMAEKLAVMAQAENDSQQLGNAYLYQGRIANQKNLVKLSAQKLDLAIEQFEIVKDLKRHADALSHKSWLAYVDNNYAGVKSSLLKSAQLALEANDIERELHALTYLSVMAHKARQDEDKYRYLTEAENKMRAYELPIYRFAKIPFHHAIYSETKAAKEPHLVRVLEFTALTPDHWVAQSSRKQLMLFYIEQNRLANARELLVRATSDNVENSYLKTLLAKTEQNTKEFFRHAQRTFEQAQLAGDKYLSLDVALLICSTPNQHMNHDIYLEYIKENATANWRRSNESQLIALNL